MRMHEVGYTAVWISKTEHDQEWSLADNDGIELLIAFIFKHQLLLEQSTICYKYNSASIFTAWKIPKATYRGKGDEDAPPLSYAKIKRMSLMMGGWEVRY
jgi:hypothetical protein